MITLIAILDVIMLATIGGLIFWWEFIIKKGVM